jgi:hypothetical protein
VATKAPPRTKSSLRPAGVRASNIELADAHLLLRALPRQVRVPRRVVVEFIPV